MTLPITRAPLCPAILALAALVLAGCAASQPAPTGDTSGPVQPKVDRLIVAAVPPNAETNETRNVNTRDNWQIGVIYDRLFANLTTR